MIILEVHISRDSLVKLYKLKQVAAVMLKWPRFFEVWTERVASSVAHAINKV